MYQDQMAPDECNCDEYETFDAGSEIVTYGSETEDNWHVAGIDGCALEPINY